EDDGDDELQGDPERFAEIVLADRRAVVLQAGEGLVVAVEQGVVEEAGEDREEDREQHDQHQAEEAWRGHQPAEATVGPLQPVDVGYRRHTMKGRVDDPPPIAFAISAGRPWPPACRTRRRPGRAPAWRPSGRSPRG